ncbi:hypothetical protein MMYC01_207944 [Madurella mycetomatis]|uniref:Uncharacterized protein n=1 Tax=Madurella mycetomatis TaxID=100816 RepID=A0A175VU35_9PEZI|nr:hypothetical protein MMYC01_207944 [Madurella mycetomatis]
MALRKALGFKAEPSAQQPCIRPDRAPSIASNNETFHIVKPDQDDNATCSIASSPTPLSTTHTSPADRPQPHPCALTTLHPTAIRDATPWPSPHRTFLIVPHTPSSPSPPRALALTNGVLRLVPLAASTAHQGSWYWRCVENGSGWLGFRNTASGTYLGHDCFRRVRATAPHHMGWEYVCLRRCPGGGYVMGLVALTGEDKERDGFGRLLRVAEREVKSEEDGGLVLVGDGEGEAVVWEFVEVGC